MGFLHNYAAPAPMRATMTPPSRPGMWFARMPGTHAWTVYEVIQAPDGLLGYRLEPNGPWWHVDVSRLEWSSRPTQEIPR